MSGAIAVARPPQPPRLRRESQRPGIVRNMTRPPNAEDESVKQDTKRYVYTQPDILARHQGKPPSLRVYLHPKHFRINDSQETLSYASPMRELLQAIKDKVVPHNMVEDLYDIGTPWYDNCLIVEVHDYRSGAVKPRDDTNSTGDGGKSAFSVHNYNSFITPSPFAPFPANTPAAKPAKPAADAPDKDSDAKENKENMPAPGQAGAAHPKPALGKVVTVVLFPTPQSQLADMQLLATTPVPDMAALKRMQAQGRAAGMPPTPLTAVPPTPTFPIGPSPKRQKTIIDDSNVHEFEAEVLNATCPKLYLEPTKSLAESLALMDYITHPNNKNPAPARKTRKRTTAELAADDAAAQDLQRFMLAGDEHQATMASAATGNDEGAARGDPNTQTFSRFKTIAGIRAAHEDADRRKKEEDARVAQAKRQAQMEAELQRKRDHEANRQQAEVAEQRQQLLRQQAHQAQLQQNQLQQNEALRAATAAQHQMSNVAASQIAPTPQSTTQSQFSPVVRQQTPMTAAAASPRVGGQTSHPMGGAPMAITASNHAIASPARPPSAVSHHPNQMARSVSQQQNLSRTGTPQMVQGTPVMNPSMPNRNMTPTPSRMNQTSPSMSMQGQTPMMMQVPQSGQNNMTPEAMHQLQNQQRIQALRMQQLQQGASPGNQQLQQIAVQKATQHIQAQGVPQGQNPQQYRNHLAQQYFRQLQQQQANQQQQQAMQNMSPQGNGLPPNGMPQQGMSFANLSLQQMRLQYQQRRNAAAQMYINQNQPIPANVQQQLQQMDLTIKQREQREQQHAQMQHMQNAGMGGQMQGAQINVNGMQNGAQGNAAQMQQYQQMLQQQRLQQANTQQQRMVAMRQQAMANGAQLPPGMMGNMQGMTMAQINQMQGMQGIQGVNGMNMAQMGQMGQMQGAGIQGAQMNGMQVNGMGMGQLSQQQMQQMMMMRQAQQQAQRMGQPGQPQQGGGGEMGWSGV
ncbi:hypothetical protein EJ02DRAFT_401550 [Clathrospora elynae]|uniref:Spt20-like SEP domain-containing protein n=1 Tax=Clathrospora elynae TaxID=706981 RepID=A0A6A5STK2_9PLEO|nr:hypothetical protein EJ02DRAFT_401550 [Clathrospora elynae]